MFRITGRTCHVFTFGVLITAGTNVESVVLSSEGVRANAAAAQSKYVRHVFRTGVTKAPQL
jgi:hypothetical protein